MQSKAKAARTAKMAAALQVDAIAEAVDATFAVLDDAAETGNVSAASRERLGRSASALRATQSVDGPRRPIRTASIPLTLDGYPDGIHAVMRINPPMRDYEALSTDTRGTLRRLILEWTLPDENGQTVVLDDTLSGATDEELAALLQGWYEALKQRTTLGKP